MTEPLSTLRLRLTAWYAGTFGIILALLGAGLFITIRNTPSRQLDASLRDATAALIQAALARESQVMGGSGQVVDAIDQLHLPGRTLYLLDVGGRQFGPTRRRSGCATLPARPTTWRIVRQTASARSRCRIRWKVDCLFACTRSNSSCGAGRR